MLKKKDTVAEVSGYVGVRRGTYNMGSNITQTFYDITHGRTGYPYSLPLIVF